MTDQARRCLFSFLHRRLFALCALVISFWPLPATAQLVEMHVTTSDSNDTGCADPDCTTADCPGCDQDCESDEEPDIRLNFYELLDEPFSTYRSETSSSAWMPGSGDQFGWFSITSSPYLRRGNKSGVTGAANIHWLSGPDSVPLPPRLYDLVIGYQHRDSLSEDFSYDLFASAGLHSDFEDSARDGKRFPAHAVGSLHMTPNVDLVFGVEYLDRDDLKLLPVYGFSMRNQESNLRFDMVFPRPRIEYTYSNSNRVFLQATTNGGNWDIEYPNEQNDVINYHDMRITLGFESAAADEEISGLEFNYVFDRQLNFRSQTNNMALSDAFMISWSTWR